MEKTIILRCSFKNRLDDITNCAEEIKDFIKLHSTGDYMYALENMETSNPHIQCFFIHNQNVKLQALRVQLQKIVGKGNKSYSFTTYKPNNDDLVSTDHKHYPVGYLSYLMKQGTYVMSLPDEVESVVREYQETVEEEMKEKKAKTKVWKAIMETVKPVDAKQPDITVAIKEAIIQYHIDNELIVSKFRLQQYYHTIMLNMMEYPGERLRYALGHLFDAS